MSKRRILLIGVLIAVLATVALVLMLSREREPEYGGKRLSEWVEGYGNTTDIAKSGKTELDRTDTAIRHIGTNALPFLREWFRYDPGPMKVKVYAVANGWMRTFNQKWTFRDHRAIRADYVPVAMYALGSEIGIAEMSGAIKDPNAHWSALRAANLLRSFGEFSSLVPGLTNRHEEVRENVANLMGYIGTNGLFAVPGLLRLLHDPSARVREAATNALRRIDPKALERAAP